jgi:hypothetical protein
MISLELKTKELASTAPVTPVSDIEKAKRQQQGLPPEATRPPEREVTIDLVSVAPNDGDVAKYIAALTKCQLFTDVNLLFSEEYKVGKDDSAKTVRKFHVEMKVDPKADLRQVDSSSSSL